MGFVRYRDPSSGRFISRRSASHITSRPVRTESYSTHNKRTADTAGYFRGLQAVQKSILIEPGLDLGIPPDFIQAALLAEPDLTLEELIELASDLGVDFEGEDFEVWLLEELDEDQEFYKEA